MTMSSLLRRRAMPLVALTALLPLTACTGTASGSRDGGDPPPTVLRIGTDDPEGRPASNQIEEFARQVDALSEGRIRVEPVFRALGEENQESWDQKVARLVVSGELDLGMIPARAWDTEGVETLRALHAPFLVQSEDHVAAAVSDADLSADLLAGLDEVGVTGLALLPESLRRIFVFDDVDVTSATFQGTRVRSPRSDTTWALFEALGAEPTDAAVDDTVAAAESELALAGTLGRSGVVVGNLTFFPKVNALVVNSKRFEALPEEHQQALRDAAVEAREWAISQAPDEQALADAFCEAGGRIMHMAYDELDALRAAAGPVTDMLRRDESTASLMERVETLGGSTSPSVVGTCGGSEPPTTETIEPDGGALPDGTYRVEFTDDYLESYGLTPEEVENNRGVWTIELRDGTWSVHQVAPGYEDEFGDVYQVDGKSVYWRFYEGEPVVQLTWSTTDRGDLQFEFVEGADDARFHFGRPWRRVA